MTTPTLVRLSRLRFTTMVRSYVRSLGRGEAEVCSLLNDSPVWVEVEDVVFVTGAVPHRTLADELAATAWAGEVIVVGDAFVPRDAQAAISGAHFALRKA